MSPKLAFLYLYYLKPNTLNPHEFKHLTELIEIVKNGAIKDIGIVYDRDIYEVLLWKV